MNDVDDSIVVAPSAIVKRVAHAGLLFGADDESLKFASTFEERGFVDSAFSQLGQLASSIGHAESRMEKPRSGVVWQIHPRREPLMVAFIAVDEARRELDLQFGAPGH